VSIFAMPYLAPRWRWFADNVVTHERNVPLFFWRDGVPHSRSGPHERLRDVGSSRCCSAALTDSARVDEPQPFA